MILVKSVAFDNLKKNKSVEKYITLLDFEPDYKEMVDSTGKLNQSKIDKHYFNSILFLKKISKTFNKKVVICIHPKYDLKKSQKSTMNFKWLNLKPSILLINLLLCYFMTQVQ